MAPLLASNGEDWSTPVKETAPPNALVLLPFKVTDTVNDEPVSAPANCQMFVAWSTAASKTSERISFKLSEL